MSGEPIGLVADALDEAKKQEVCTSPHCCFQTSPSPLFRRINLDDGWLHLVSGDNANIHVIVTGGRAS